MIQFSMKTQKQVISMFEQQKEMISFIYILYMQFRLPRNKT